MEFHYSSATQLLALIIERITNKSVSNYLETKIWQPLGISLPIGVWTEKMRRVWKKLLLSSGKDN
jgi:CubicO group peptidase (beta-lactamase class C family)